jgi:hypothetical protein
MFIIVIRILCLHCKGKQKRKTLSDNKAMFLLMILFFLFVEMVRYSISPLPETLEATFIMIMYFFQSVIILRICKHFLDHGMDSFHDCEIETKKMKCFLKIVMISVYVIYFGMAIARIILGIELSLDDICRSPVYVLTTSTNIVVSTTMLVVGCKLKKGLHADIKLTQ